MGLIGPIRPIGLMKTFPQFQAFFERLWGRQAPAWQKTDCNESLQAGRLCSQVLGLSGGLDSVALFHLLRLNDIEFTAVHFHHGLRETADCDAEFCKALCEKHDISLDIIELDVPTNKLSNESIEEAARRLRLDYYRQNLPENSIVLLAHHRDDLRENFLLRTLRGSNSSGLTGLREIVEIQGRTYARPMLKIGKDELRDWLEFNNFTWIEDESNQENDFNRNKIRNIVLPELSKVASLKGIDRSLENLAQDADFIQQEAERIAKSKPFTCETLIELHPALFPRVIRIYLNGLYGEDRLLKASAIERLKKEIESIPQHGKTLTLQDDVTLKISGNGTISKKIKSKPSFEYQWDWQNQPILEIPSLNACLTIETNKPITNRRSQLSLPKSLFTDHGSLLTVRSWKDGDSIIPAGKDTPQKLKKIFSKAKISAEEKNDYPLLCLGDQILWIIGLQKAQLNEGDDNVTISFR